MCRISVGLLLVGLAMPVAASAQTNDEVFPNLQWNFATPGARAHGMGRTFIGLADDATAAVTNPAGLLNLTRPQIYGEYRNTRLNFDRLSTTDSLTTKVPTRTTRDISDFSFVSVSAPVGSRLAVAGSVNRFLNYKENVNNAARRVPGSTDIFFPVVGTVDFNGTSFGGSAAFMLNKHLRVGATIAANVLDLGAVATRYRFNSSLASTGIVVNETTISGTHTALSATVGALVKASDNVSVGFSYNKAPRYTTLENLQFNPSTTSNGALTTVAGFPLTIDINVPDRFGVGASVRANPKLVVAADVVHVQYSSLSKNTALVFESGSVLSSDYSSPDVTEIHAGAEYNVYTWRGYPVFVRGGLFTNPDHLVTFNGTGVNSLPDTQLDVLAQRAIFNSLPRKDEVRGTLGAGFVVGRRAQIDFAYAFGGDFVASAAIRF
jgi:long-subunit fatty acid transport protein